ncbi:MAG: hypothetical protein AAFR52_12860 [Pseudomonadota bacterium]
MTVGQQDFVIARGLSPRDAPAAREALLTWLGALADAPGTPVLDVESGDRRPTPAALQLLAAALRRSEGPRPPLGAEAGGLAAEIGLVVEAGS